MASKQFQGVYTAIVTPFRKDQSVDWTALESLVGLQIAGGVAGIVPCGTTGESPTLSEEEQGKVIAQVVKWVNKRCQVIAGTGSNSTAKTIHLSRHAEEVGADGLLIVNPYYNKPTQEGLYRHFVAVAESVKIPLVVYNIRGRTAVNVETPTLERIIKARSNVVAVKEASGDLNQMKQVLDVAPSYFSVLSGDDNLTYELLKLGGSGVVSVASNVIPKEMVELVQHCLAGEFDRAKTLHERYSKFFEGLFLETNPIPVKAALAMKGLCEEVYRLPICEMSADKRAVWKKMLEEYSLL